jgi:arylsulfatase A-like enzyme
LALDRSILDEGWSKSESTEEDGDFVWVNGVSASFSFPTRKFPTPARIAFRARPYVYSGSPPQTIRVFWNDRLAADLEMNPGWHDYEIAIPPNSEKRDVNGLRLEFGYSAVPSEVTPPSADRRNLSVAFQLVTVPQAYFYSRLEGESRESLVLGPGSEYEFSVTLPEHPVLQVDERIFPDPNPPASGKIRWAVLLRRFGIERKILDRVTDPATDPNRSNWVRYRVPLGRWANRRVTLAFRSLAKDTERSLPAVLLGTPTVVNQTPNPKVPNVLLISLDTLRRDHLGLYGYHRDTSPNLDRLGAGGAVFENAVSPSAWTLPSHVSLMTSLYPVHHGVVTMHQRMDESTLTGAKLLRLLPFASKGLITHTFVDAQYGFHFGFESFEHVPTHRAEDVTTEAINWLQGAGPAPFFLFLHYFDPHTPYNAPEPFREMYDYDYRGDVAGTHSSLVEYAKRGHIPEKDLHRVIALYDGEIRYLDDQLGRLFHFLKISGRWENTLLIVTSDHGEEFWDHQSFGHGATLYQEQVHVPLIIHYRDWFPNPVRIDQVVSTVDILPTVLDILDLPIPEGWDGRSLRPLRYPENSTWENRAFSETTRTDYNLYLTSVQENLEKGIWSKSDKKFQTFNLAEDPGETSDLTEVEPDRANRLNRLVEEFLSDESEKGKGVAKGGVHLDEATRERLRALGYLH